tara:strand:- start:8929 stop:9135 length:207 start_codon:yes stop_codon:yes gene_type:complete
MKFDLFEVVLILLAGIGIGAYLMGIATSDNIANNTVKGYHCQPIQKVQTLEEAKALIDGYHAKAKVGG